MVGRFKLNNGLKALPDGKEQLFSLNDFGSQEGKSAVYLEPKILKIDDEFDKY